LFDGFVYDNWLAAMILSLLFCFWLLRKRREWEKVKKEGNVKS